MGSAMRDVLAFWGWVFGWFWDVTIAQLAGTLAAVAALAVLAVSGYLVDRVLTFPTAEWFMALVGVVLLLCCGGAYIWSLAAVYDRRRRARQLRSVPS